MLSGSFKNVVFAILLGDILVDNTLTHSYKYDFIEKEDLTIVVNIFLTFVTY